MSADLLENFRQSMRRFATTVSVITCGSDGARHGMTATAVTSLCFEPMSVLACINGSSSLIAPLLRENRFCVNVLHESQAEISRMFGGQAKGAQRFESGRWLDGEGGVPFLADAQANLFCQVDQVVPYATHQIVIGRIVDARFSADVAPLIYQNGAYGGLAPLPAFVPGASNIPAPVGACA